MQGKAERGGGEPVLAGAAEEREREAGRRKVGGGQGRVRKACGTLSQEDDIRASEARVLGSPMPGREPGALECPLRSRRDA